MSDILSMPMSQLVAMLFKIAIWNVWPWMLIVGCMHLPGVSAAPVNMPFPNIPFYFFSKFILEQFGTSITLLTVLILLFSLTHNTDLLNLHGRQQNPQYEIETQQTVTG
jgi:hypothetical protein